MKPTQRRTAARIATVVALLGAVCGGASPAAAAGPQAARPVAAVAGTALTTTVPTTATTTVTTTVRPATARVVDEDNGLLLFVNKSRADLCTPERIAFENAFVAWLADPQGEPPAEPVASRQGVRPVTFTHRDLPAGGTLDRSVGLALPVEVWRLDDQGDGIDCTATDGPGAALFATGTVDWTDTRLATGSAFVSDTRLESQIVGTDGTRYRYLVDYRFQQAGNDPGVFTPTIRLVPVRGTR